MPHRAKRNAAWPQEPDVPNPGTEGPELIKKRGQMFTAKNSWPQTSQNLSSAGAVALGWQGKEGSGY